MKCPECNGRGETIYYAETNRDENTVTIEQRKGVCRMCNGSGQKPMTNADRIRAMSDEELAALICKRKPMCSWPNGVQKIFYSTRMTGVEAWTHWLQQPAEDDC